MPSSEKFSQKSEIDQTTIEQSNHRLSTKLVFLLTIIITLITAYIVKKQQNTIIPQEISHTTHTSTMPTSVVKPRSILKIIEAIEQAEGVGAKVRRSIGTMKMRNFTPFLMLDHFKVAPTAGFPDHPHRGQETVTYLMKGQFAHEDFTGASGVLSPGDLQFMTAGKGIVHSEMPVPNDDGSDIEGMQLWVDLPKELKHCDPRYRDLRAAEIPIAKPNDKVTVKVISGNSYGVESLHDLAYTPMAYYDFEVQPGGKFEQPIEPEFNAFVYVLKGSIDVNGTTVPQFHNAFFKQNGDGIIGSVHEDDKESARFVVIAGQALNQPIVQHGPFVETSREEIMKAFIDYQNHQNGFERALNWESEIGKRLTHRY